MAKKFWNWIKPTNDGETAELVIDGTIAADSWFDDDVTPRMFERELEQVQGDVVIWLNSPGGDCIAASQIYTMLIAHKGNVTVKIDGIAASAASVIAMAGTTVLMAPTALMMIHNPMTMAFGDHTDLEKAQAMLDEVKKSIINAYALRTGLSDVQLSHMMENETWMNAKRAIELGFADGMLTDEKREQKDDALEFSARTIERAVACKLENRYPKQVIAPAIPEPEKPANNGRNVDELMKQLHEKLI